MKIRSRRREEGEAILAPLGGHKARCMWTQLVSGAKLAPKGRLRKAPGRKPWEHAQQQHKPRRGEAVGAGIKEVPYDEPFSGVETKAPCAAPSGLSTTWTLNPGLAPWAVTYSLASFFRKTPALT